ncbi:hypothetical protein BH23ACT6_BH23ACT6_00110 [soil metagenome]
MSRKAARYRLVAHPDVPDDLASLSTYGADAVVAARLTLDDLAHGRVTGKRLGERQVTGDLTGLTSVKFDVQNSPTRRFRLVYAEIDTNTRGVLAIGTRKEHAIYRLAVERMRLREEERSHGNK